MNRSFKVFVATVLALSLCLSFGSAFAKKETKPPKAPAPVVSITEFSLNDRIGTISPDVNDVYTVVTGQKYMAKVVLSEGKKTSLRWRSTKHGVANVDNRGNIHCVRTGNATITVSDKSGTLLKSINLSVVKNIATFTSTEDNSVQKIYLKGKYIYVDILIRNNTSEVMETPPDLTLTLTLSRGTSPAAGLKTGHLRDEIPAGETGIAFYRIGKVNPSTVWLLGATCIVA